MVQHINQRRKRNGFAVYKNAVTVEKDNITGFKQLLDGIWQNSFSIISYGSSSSISCALWMAMLNLA